MNLNKQNLTPFVIIALLSNVIFPTWRLTFFAPLLVMLYYRKSLAYCLWCSLCFGMLLDLMSSQSRFGFFSITYCLTSVLLFPQKRYFFADRLSTLPIMTLLFVEISTLLQFLIIPIAFEGETKLTLKWAATDLLIMPLLDVVYACMFFLLPILAAQKLHKTRIVKKLARM